MVKDETYYNSLDKRTREYKEWAALRKSQDELNETHSKLSKGLGDTIEKITEKTGVKKLVKFLAGEDCGCDERKETLNNLFAYKVPKCLEENEYHFLAVFFKKSTERHIPSNEWNEVLTIYNRIFEANEKQCGNCGNRNYKTIYVPLKKVFDTYK